MAGPSPPKWRWPVKIAEDLRPAPHGDGAKIQRARAVRHEAGPSSVVDWAHVPLPTPSTWTEIAGRYPDVPIVLTKMGRGIAHYFESALIVAMRNPNVYFDRTYSSGEVHIRRAVRTIGLSDRMMFGSDWAVV